MILNNIAIALLILCFAVTVTVAGEKNEDPAKSTSSPTGARFPAFAPKINEKKKLVIPSGFKKGEGPSGLGKHWIIGNGKWEIRDDAVTAIRLEGDDHSAGLRSDIGQLPDRFILEFKFRFDSDANNKEGKHKFNLRVMGNGKALVLHPTTDSLVARTMAGGGSVVLVEKKVNLAVNKWHSVMIEVRDEACCVQMSSADCFDVRHEQIKKRKKKFFVFNVGKARASVKDVRFWTVK